MWQRQDSIPCCRSGPMRQLARSWIRFEGFLLDFCSGGTSLSVLQLSSWRDKSHSEETTTTITMLQGFGSWAVRLARCTSLVIGFRHESRKLGQELNTFGRMSLTGENLKSIALRQFRGQFHQQPYHFQRLGDIVILGCLLRGWTAALVDLSSSSSYSSLDHSGLILHVKCNNVL